MSDNQNVFRIARYRHHADEDQLSELLCWLISVVPEVGAIVMSFTFPGTNFDEPVQASTQHAIPGGRLDLLLRGDDAWVVVESKLGAELGPDQLTRYAEWLADQPDPSHRAVLALTQRAMPWPEPAAARARELSVRQGAARWEDLYSRLGGLRSDLNAVSARLVGEFREMLEEEGIIPVKPLDADEVVDAWSRADATISHYHEFFRACVDNIAEALGADVVPGKSESIWWTYRTFERSGQRFWLGISCEGLDRLPFIWISRDIEWQGVEALTKQWAEKLPAGWRVDAAPGFYGRPLIACSLREIVRADTFDAQSAQLAAASAAALAGWPAPPA